MAEGLTNGEIGQIIGSTEYTTKNVLRFIFDKTGLSSRLELALWYVKYSEDLKQ